MACTSRSETSTTNTLPCDAACEGAVATSFAATDAAGVAGVSYWDASGSRIGVVADLSRLIVAARDVNVDTKGAFVVLLTKVSPRPEPFRYDVDLTACRLSEDGAVSGCRAERGTFDLDPSSSSMAASYNVELGGARNHLSPAEGMLIVVPEATS